MISCTIIAAVVTCMNMTPAARRPTPQQALAILTASIPPFVTRPVPQGPTVTVFGNGLPTLGPWDDVAQKLRPQPLDWQQLDWFAPGLPVFSYWYWPPAAPAVAWPSPFLCRTASCEQSRKPDRRE